MALSEAQRVSAASRRQLGCRKQMVLRKHGISLLTMNTVLVPPALNQASHQLRNRIKYCAGCQGMSLLDKQETLWQESHRHSIYTPDGLRIICSVPPSVGTSNEVDNACIDLI